jgi:surface polysaccharide O-acyltransferase-like enzyme
VIFASPGVAEHRGKLGRLAGVAILVGIISLFPLRAQLQDWERHFGTVGYGAAQLAQALLSWGLLIGFITLGSRVLNFKNRFLAYASEAVLPFYILHQTVIIMVGYYVVRWALHPALKYLIIVLVSFALIVVLYDLLIRRIRVLRILFGMRGIRKPG